MKIDHVAQAEAVLAANDQGGWTRPAEGLYSHQWLWDSCFIAIGLAKVNPERAATELVSLLRGQWQDGFLPHMIYAPGTNAWEAELWHGADSQLLPSGVRTSAITQPPMVAVAAEHVAAALDVKDRATFLAQMVPAILRYHLWLYDNRQPASSGGLVALVHPWESGMDDTPPWTQVMHHSSAFEVFNFLRRDTKYVRRSERPTSNEEAKLMELALQLRHYRRDSEPILDHFPVLVGDVTFNSILIWNNEALVRLAKLAKIELPEEFYIAARRNIAGLKHLWNGEDGRYYHFDLRHGEPIRVPSVATLLPLLTVAPDALQVETLRSLLEDRRDIFAVAHPVPTVPVDSDDFEPDRYWRGPVWININWLIIQGLQRHGLKNEATKLQKQTLELIEKHGCREYFSPLTGEGLGAHDFSWTAALYLDLAKA